ncbi:hypothetical protein KR018_010909 [Drosophila ironensis]|nr:hypothetical protein KR018_010909 [Drosophila ironensis]
MRSITLIIVTTVVVLYLLEVSASRRTCKGKPASPKCEGLADAGNKKKRKCRKSANKNMWHFNNLTKKCSKLDFKGCGGNDNRWCTQKLCEGCLRLPPIG